MQRAWVQGPRGKVAWPEAVVSIALGVLRPPALPLAVQLPPNHALPGFQNPTSGMDMVVVIQLLSGLGCQMPPPPIRWLHPMSYPTQTFPVISFLTQHQALPVSQAVAEG